IVAPGPVEALPMKSLRRQYDVNVFGLIETTQVFLPIIRETKGRIVNMSSVGGLISTPFLGAYNSTKFAVEAFSDSLRRELRVHGVKVIAIEPGTISTPIWEKGLNNSTSIRSEMKPESLAPYEDGMNRFERQVKRTSQNGISPDEVAQSVRRALTNSNPAVRELVLSNTERFQLLLVRRLPTKWVDKLLQKVYFRK
ncbi:MAG: SDR family NAD(P)-dependent oxidoreductase, partial [Bdellovibrionota bacterium]